MKTDSKSNDDTTGFLPVRELWEELAAEPVPSVSQRRIAQVGVLVANVLPAVCVVVLGWDIFTVVFLYWLENVVIGLMTVARILVAGGFKKKWLSNLLVVPFFVFHYGIFTTVHGVFVIALFGNLAAGGKLQFDAWFVVTLLALFLEHGRQFVTDYLWSGAYLTANAGQQMSAPYGRVVVLHMVIVLGGFLMAVFRLPALAVLLLIAFKVAYEWQGAGSRNQRDGKDDETAS